MNLLPMVSRIILPAVVALGLLNATAAQAQTARADDLALARAVATRYDSAFAAMVARVDSADPQLGVLHSLAGFKSRHVAWAVEREGALFAIAPSQAAAWLVVVPENDPMFARMESILTPAHDATVPATRIKPDTIAAPWAAIFLSYALSHLADQVMEVLPADPSPSDLTRASLRAYGLEYRAAQAIGGRPFVAHLDSIVALERPDSAVALALRLPDVLRRDYDALNGYFGTQAALTDREEQRRAGVLAISVLFRYAGTRNVSDEELGRALHCFGGCRASP